MLFGYRPPQTWMPYSMPQNRMTQADYNLRLQSEFAATRRVARPVPSASESDRIDKLQRIADLHDRGVLSDAEFAAEKDKLLAVDAGAEAQG